MKFSTLEQCLFIMDILGVNPRKIGSKLQLFIFSFYLANLFVLIFMVMMLFVKEDDMSLLEITDIFNNFLLQMHGVVYLVCFYAHRPQIMSLLTDTEEKFWKASDYSIEIMEDYSKAMNTLRKKYLSYVSIYFIAAVFHVYGRILEDGRKIPVNLLFRAYIPENLSFWTMFMWEHIPLAGVMLSQTAMDVLILVINSLTVLQFKLLRYEVEHLFSDVQGDNARAIDIKQRIKRTTANNTFSTMMFVYIGVIVLLSSIEIYLTFLTESVEEMSKFVLSTVYTFFVFFICYCYPAQELTTEAENLAESVYSCEWYNFPEFQKDVLILLGKSRIKVAFNMGGILDLNLETGMAAVKAILSYSMFLRTMTLLEDSSSKS